MIALRLRSRQRFEAMVCWFPANAFLFCRDPELGEGNDVPFFISGSLNRILGRSGTDFNGVRADRSREYPQVTRVGSEFQPALV